jgi:hypothetical protein
MKKLIAVSAVAALAATALSAEITFGIWGRTLWNVAANGSYTETKADGTTEKKDTVVSDIHQSWGGAAPRIGLTVAADSENYGFNFQIFNNGSNADGQCQGGNAYVWVKPIEQVKIYAGKLDVNLLSGDACFGLWDWDRIGNVNGVGEQWTFEDYLDCHNVQVDKLGWNSWEDAFGTSIVVTPVEGLTLGVGIPLNYEDKKDADKDGPTTLSGIYAHNAAYVGAYNIQGIGTVKAALKTLPKTSDDKSQNQLGVAFDLTAVENLFVSVGAKINTNSDAHDKKVNAYARYGVNEQLTVHAIVGTKLSAVYEDKDNGSKDDGFGFLAGAGIDYNLDGGIGVFADVRYSDSIYTSGTKGYDNADNLTLGVGVAKNYSNGSLGIAFEGSTNAKGRYALKDADAFSWEVPVRFQYSF